MPDEVKRRIGKLDDVVRRNRGRHADGDPLRAVRQKVGDAGRKKHRLFRLAVIGCAEIDRVLVDAVEKALRDIGHPGFGIAHGGGVIAVDIAEIPLPVDKPVAHREFLREPHHGVIDRGVAMRVKLTHDVADDTGRFLEALIRVETKLAHRIEKTAVHGLQPVTHIGKRPRRDRRQGIGKVAFAERLGKGRVDNPPTIVDFHAVTHLFCSPPDLVQPS